MEGDPQLIVLHSVKGAGKDTTFRFAKEWGARRTPALSAVRRGFADKVKLAFARQFFPSISEEDAIKWVDTFKDHPFAEIEFPTSVEENQDEYNIGTVMFRQAIAQFATESAREVYGLDHWCAMVIPEAPTHQNPEGWRGNFLVPPRSEADFPYSFAHFAFITDCRFPSEMEYVKRVVPEALFVKIRRRDAEQAVRDEALRQCRAIHESELGMPDHLFDVVINNDNNNLDDARRRTAALMHEIDYNGAASIKAGNPVPWVIK